MSNLNQEQTQAAEEILKFLLDPDSRVFHLVGPGGVGKSHMIRFAVDEGMKQYHLACDIRGTPQHERLQDVHLTATTNPAAAVLSEFVGAPTSTIHSLLGLGLRTDSEGVDHLTRRPVNGQFVILEKAFIVIDEGSYISRNLEKFIENGTLQCKILYVSDDCQLFPVKEGKSPIYNKGQSFELTQIQRTSDPVIKANNLALRNAIKTGDYTTPIKLQLRPGVVDHFGPDQLTEMQTLVDSTFLDFEASPKSHILAYSNACIDSYSAYVRQLKGMPELGFPIDMPVQAKVNAFFEIKKVVSFQCEQTVTVIGGQHFTEEFYGVDMHLQEVFVDGIRCVMPLDLTHWKKLQDYAWSQKDTQIALGLKNKYISLRSPEAMTTHKAQGGTYDNVFIDLHNLTSCRQPALFMRLLYVAFSRAKKRVAFFGQPQKQYAHLFEWEHV